MYCNKCGKQLKDDAKFCTACGNPVVRVKGADKFINMANAGMDMLGMDKEKVTDAINNAKAKATETYDKYGKTAYEEGKERATEAYSKYGKPIIKKGVVKAEKAYDDYKPIVEESVAKAEKAYDDYKPIVKERVAKAEKAYDAYGKPIVEEGVAKAHVAYKVGKEKVSQACEDAKEKGSLAAVGTKNFFFSINGRRVRGPFIVFDIAAWMIRSFICSVSFAMGLGNIIFVLFVSLPVIVLSGINRIKRLHDANISHFAYCFYIIGIMVILSYLQFGSGEKVFEDLLATGLHSSNVLVTLISLLFSACRNLLNCFGFNSGDYIQFGFSYIFNVILLGYEVVVTLLLWILPSTDGRNKYDID